MLKMNKDIDDMHALMTMICQDRMVGDSYTGTAKIMLYTGRSRRWCISWMRELKKSGLITIGEIYYRSNRSAFQYAPTAFATRLHRAGNFYDGYKKFMNRKIAYHQQVINEIRGL